MKLRLRRQESVRGEWSVLDRIRGYRICRYDHPHPSAPLAAVEVETAQEAETVMRRYDEKHDAFDLTKLQEVIKTWKSESAAA